MAASRSLLGRALGGLNGALKPLGVTVVKAGPSISTFHDVSDVVSATYRQVAAYTMTSPERIYALCEAVRYVADRNIPGSIVECGVWRGGSSMAVALTLLERGLKKELHLFDTFEGMPKSTERDYEIATKRSAQEMHDEEVARTGHFIAVSAEEVEENMRSTHYDMTFVHLHKGLVEQTIPSKAPKDIALVRLDTDWYESTRHELIHLWPRLSIGGVLIIDDYGHFAGCRDAVDEFFASRPVVLNRIDYTGRLVLKCFAD